MGIGGAASSSRLLISSSSQQSVGAKQLKKTVRNMFMMKAMGPRGPRFHTDLRAEHRKVGDTQEESERAASRFDRA